MINVRPQWMRKKGRKSPHLANAPDVGEMKDQFGDIPFISRCPSLDESIDFLKSVQDKAIIVASNSPYRKLINSGIRPHLVVTADPLSPTLAGFENVSLENVPLACPFSAYPEIVKRFSGRILTWCTFNPIVDLLKDRLGLRPGTKILEQGTVSGCVLDLSKLFGCKKVLLVGQDMAVRMTGDIILTILHMQILEAHYSSTEKGQRLPGNTQEKVLVEGRLFVYLKTFEQFIAKTPKLNTAISPVRVSKSMGHLIKHMMKPWIGFQILIVKFLIVQSRNFLLIKAIAPI